MKNKIDQLIDQCIAHNERIKKLRQLKNAMLAELGELLDKNGRHNDRQHLIKVRQCKVRAHMRRAYEYIRP